MLRPVRIPTRVRMYVCICNALTDRCIDKAIHSGARTVGAVYRSLGERPQCGKCACDIRSRLACSAARMAAAANLAHDSLAIAAGD
jgi:bacterioferritin-associated ferredoxin